MADIGGVKSFLGSLDKDTKLAMEQVFTYVLNNLSLGTVEHQTRATNLQAYYLLSTTPSVANAEFSISHGLGGTPSVLVPVLPLNQIGAQIIPLRVSRAADDKRVYLTSSSTSAAIAVLVG